MNIMQIQLCADSEANCKLKLFLCRYLNPKARLDEPCGAWHRMCERATELNWPLVAKLIRARVIGPEDATNGRPCSGPLAWRDKGGYSHFRHTIYWKLVARAVKERDDYQCVKCGRRNIRSCEAHHLDYECLGSEHLQLHRLQTLCCVCHDLEHGDKLSAVIHEYELLPSDPIIRLGRLSDDICGIL